MITSSISLSPEQKCYLRQSSLRMTASRWNDQKPLVHSRVRPPAPLVVHPSLRSAILRSRHTGGSPRDFFVYLAALAHGLFHRPRFSASRNLHKVQVRSVSGSACL